MRVVTLLSTAAGAVDDATPVTATVLGPPSLEAPGLAGDAFRFLRKRHHDEPSSLCTRNAKNCYTPQYPQGQDILQYLNYLINLNHCSLATNIAMENPCG